MVTESQQRGRGSCPWVRVCNILGYNHRPVEGRQLRHRSHRGVTLSAQTPPPGFEQVDGGRRGRPGDGQLHVPSEKVTVAAAAGKEGQGGGATRSDEETMSGT